MILFSVSKINIKAYILKCSFSRLSTLLFNSHENHNTTYNIYM